MPQPIEELAALYDKLGIPYKRSTFGSLDTLVITFSASRPIDDGQDEDTFEEGVHFGFNRQTGEFDGHYHDTA